MAAVEGAVDAAIARRAVEARCGVSLRRLDTQRACGRLCGAASRAVGRGNPRRLREPFHQTP